MGFAASEKRQERPGGLSRRRFLGTALLGSLGAAGLAGCGSDDSDGGAGSGGAGATSPSAASPSGPAAAPLELPAYHAADVVTADLPATAAGVSPGYFSYPADPQSFVSGTPGAGGDISTMSIIGAVPTSGTKYWNELTKRLGANLRVGGSPSSGYTDKFSTAIAGGQIADAMQILPDSVPNLPDLLEAKFQNLTDHLAGDAVKDYPALANIPSVSWKSTVYNNAIYGIPLHRSPAMWVGTARMDLVRKQGLSTQPSSGDELLEIYRALTDTKKGHYALAFPTWVLAFVSQMVGAPNDWAEENGKFTKDYETEQYSQALDIVRGMWSDGLFHPDSFASSASKGSGWYHNGVVNALVLQGAWAWHRAATAAVVPTADVNWFAPPKWEGGGTAASYIGPGIYSITALKKGSADRVAEVLRVLDYLASPFGSEESTFISYGAKGRDYTMVDGAPKVSPAGKSEVFSPWYIAFRPQVHFFPGNDESTKAEYESEKAIVTDGIARPTVGLYSSTGQSKSAGLTRTIESIQSDIIQGRKPMSAWADAVRDWRSGGGDQMRDDYEQQLQTQGTR